jgi:hypothetical protein
MAFFSVIKQVEFKTVQDVLKSAPFAVRPRMDKGDIALFIYFEDAHKNMIEIGSITLSVAFMADKENFGGKTIEEWIADHADEVIPSGVFKNN